MITVKGRTLIIPASERQIGTDYDNNAEVRTFCMNRVTPGGIDISHLLFHLDLEYAGEQKDSCDLEKQIGEDIIILTWQIPDSCVGNPGTVWVNLRGTDDFGTVKWASNKGPFYVTSTVNTPGTYSGALTELEQLEIFAEKAEAAENEREENETKRNQTFAEIQASLETSLEQAMSAESWAVGGTGTREGEDTDNSKYYSEQARVSAKAAEEAAVQAAAYGAGLVDRGKYDADETYNKGDFVLYKESTWLALQDNLSGVEPAEGDQWKYLAKGIAAELMSLIFATDTQGLLGTKGESVTGQALLDEIADRIANKVLLKSELISQIINDSTKAISAAAAYALQEQITTLNSNLEISQYDFTSAEGITVESTSKVCKFGSIAIANLRIGALPTISADGWITIATMPFSSKYNVYFDSMLYTTLGTSPIVRDGMITANAIKIYANTSDSGKRFRIAVPFIVS